MAESWPDLRLHPPPSPARVVVANRKGGSGKTTTAVQLAAALAAWGLRVRLVDGDPQAASATYWLPPQAETPTLLEVYRGEATLSEATAPTTIDRVELVPAMDALGQADSERPPGGELVLAREMDDDPRADVEIMDSPPSMGLVTVSMLTAARHVIITQRASTLDYVGTADLAGPLSRVRRLLAPELAVAAVVLIATTDRAMITAAMRERLATEHPAALLHSVPHSVRATEAPGQHLPMLAYDPAGPVTVAYWRLAAALAVRLGARWQVPPAAELLGPDGAES